MKINDNLLNQLDGNEEDNRLKQLIQHGREKGFVTIDDILAFLPDAEQDLDQLEEAFTALLNARIEYVEDASTRDVDDELAAEEEDVEEEGGRTMSFDDNYLANIDTDDMIGLYLKEVGRVPLLTAEEEVDLSQRIELGRLAR